MPLSRSTLGEGLVAGLIGYLTVAAFYVLFDLLAARGFLFTLNMLGTALFRGVRDPAVLMLPVAPDIATMTAYNITHLLVSLAVGVCVAVLVARVEAQPSVGYRVLVVLAAGFVITVAGINVLMDGIAPLLPWWTVLVVNALAALCAGGYLWRAHPGLWRRVRES